MRHSPEYIAYLQSDAWSERRLAALERASFRCEVCGDNCRLEVHHKTYERLGNEDPTDLVVLCKAHHWIADRQREGVKTNDPNTKVLCSVGEGLVRQSKLVQTKRRKRNLLKAFARHRRNCRKCR